MDKIAGVSGCPRGSPQDEGSAGTTPKSHLDRPSGTLTVFIQNVLSKVSVSCPAGIGPFWCICLRKIGWHHGGQHIDISLVL